MTARRPPAAAESAALLDEVRALRQTVGALVNQMGLAMETLSLMRADQLRILERQGLQDSAHPHVHRCTDAETPVKEQRRKKSGAGHGRRNPA